MYIYIRRGPLAKIFCGSDRFGYRTVLNENIYQLSQWRCILVKQHNGDATIFRPQEDSLRSTAQALPVPQQTRGALCAALTLVVSTLTVWLSVSPEGHGALFYCGRYSMPLDTQFDGGSAHLPDAVRTPSLPLACSQNINPGSQLGVPLWGHIPQVCQSHCLGVRPTVSKRSVFLWSCRA